MIEWRRYCGVIVVCVLSSLTSLTGQTGPTGAEAATSPFRLEETESKYLKILQGDKPVLVYNFGMMLGGGAPEKFRRSSYVHPIYGLDGEVLTDDFPRDHYHHRGVFWAWVRVEADGKTYDPWAVRGMLTKFEKWLSKETGANFASLSVQNGWYVGDQKVANEKVALNVWPSSDVGRAIDVDVTIEPTGERISIGGEVAAKKGYGGLGVRYAPRQKPVAMVMADGRQPADVIRKVSPWADYSARFGDRPTTSGIAVFAHRNNPGFPNGWLLREYGYIGLTWPGLDMVTIERGKPLHLRYRLWVHRGDAMAGRVAENYEAYAKEAAE